MARVTQEEMLRMLRTLAEVCEREPERFDVALETLARARETYSETDLAPRFALLESAIMAHREGRRCPTEIIENITKTRHLFERTSPPGAAHPVDHGEGERP
jgi:hypothetical protein